MKKINKNLNRVVSTLKLLISHYEKKATPRIPLTEIRWSLSCALECVEKQIRAKAIDDFAILMKETLNRDWATTKISEQIIYNRLFDKCNEIAEQLKEEKYHAARQI